MAYAARTGPVAPPRKRRAVDLSSATRSLRIRDALAVFNMVTRLATRVHACTGGIAIAIGRITGSFTIGGRRGTHTSACRRCILDTCAARDMIPRRTRRNRTRAAAAT